jgi:N-acetylmuramoyl-L-alanine amidase
VNLKKVSNIHTSIPISAISIYLAALALIFWVSAAIASPPLLFPERLPRIAIDPGHGGTDSGAKGPTGKLEKTISLELARQLTLKLEARCKVILTRSDDYSLAHRQRSAIANQAKADIFVAIHTGAAFLHGTNAITIYYFNPAKSADNVSADTIRANDMNRWERAQFQHKTATLNLAAALKNSLGKIEGAGGCKVRSAPLAVLEGANMPAILIEVGHITHPAGEKNLSSPQGIELLSSAIEKGIVAYLASMSTEK